MYYFALLCFFKYIPIVDNQIWNFQPNNLYWPYLEMNPKFVYYFLMNDSATSMVGSKIFSILFICVKFCYSILETSVAVVILNGNLPQHDEVKVI